MSTHSNILTWEIPWAEKCGGLQSLGWQKSWTWLSNWTATILFSTVADPIYISITSSQEFLWFLTRVFRVSSSHHPHLVSLGFLIIVILTGVRWCLTVVFSCTFLMIRDAEHLCGVTLHQFSPGWLQNLLNQSLILQFLCHYNSTLHRRKIFKLNKLVFISAEYDHIIYQVQILSSK